MVSTLELFKLISTRPLDIRKAILFLILLMAIPRMYAFREPLEFDLAAYSVIAHELFEGRSLYSDLWAQKPPGIFITVFLAQLAGGYGPGSIFLLGLVSSVLTMLGIYFAASAGGRGKETGLCAAAFWAIISADVLLQADQANVEAFMNPCFVGVLALMSRAKGRAMDRSRWLWVGVLIALATLYKHIALFFALALALAHFAFPPEGNSRRDAFSHILLIVLMGFLFWGMTFFYFFWVGHFSEFWHNLFVYTQNYAGDIFQNILLGLSPTHMFSKHAFGIFPLVGFSVLGIAICRWRPWTRTGSLFLAYVVATQIMVSSPGKYYAHYYQLWFPVLSIGAAWVVAEIQNKKTIIYFPLLRWTGALTFFALLVLQVNYYRFTPKGWSQIKFQARVLNTEVTAVKINRLLLPGETFHVWGYQPQLYFDTKRSPVSGILSSKPLFDSPSMEKLSALVRQNFSENMPDLLVVPPLIGSEKGGEKLPLFQWIIKHFRPFPQQDRYSPYKFYYRRGSELGIRQREESIGLPP